MDSPKTLLIEGWRYIPHSYAIVNQFQCLEFLRRSNLKLFHRDIPYVMNLWQPTAGLFSPDAEQAIRNIPAPTDSAPPDTILRITFPYNFTPSPARTFVFGTAEDQKVPSDYIVGRRELASVLQESNAQIITPSNWSKHGFVYSGADPTRVHLVPHGIDPSIYYPLDPQQRAHLRQQLKWSGFVFLNVGTLTPNKGINHLLKALAIVSQKHPHVRLVLKGLGALYPSEKFLKDAINTLTFDQQSAIQPRLAFYPQSFNFADLARLYQMANAYVSPYSAEGFNMPVLESIACGCPVICTAGGSTDDFTTPDFSLRINSRLFAYPPQAIGRFTLDIDFDHLVYQMTTAVESPDLASRAAIAGPAFVDANFTWQKVIDRLLPILFPPD